MLMRHCDEYVRSVRLRKQKYHENSHYFNIFGGTPAACAAALAVLEVVEQESLQANALNVGDYLIEGLKKITTNNSIIGAIRGKGLFLGIDLVRDQESCTP